jgi:capsular exopolysaccharide synthesis family protein
MNQDKDNAGFELTPAGKKESLPAEAYRPYFETEAEKIHLRDYLEILIRRKWFLIIFLVSIVTMVTIATFLLTPLYRATTTLEISRENPDIVTFENTPYMQRLKDDYFQTQYRIIKSRNLAKRVVNRLSSENISLVKKNSEGDIKNKESDRDDVDTFLKRLEVLPITKSNLVELQFTSHDPQLTAKIANTAAEEYITFTLENKTEPTREASLRLEKQIEPLRKKFEESNKRLKDFISKNQFIFLDKGDDFENLQSTKISNLSQELNKATADRILKQALYQEIKESGVNNRAVLENPEIQAIRREHITLETEYAKLSRLYESAHPKLLFLKEQLDKLEFNKIINKEAERIIKARESDYKTAVKREKFLSDTISRLNRGFTDYPQKMLQYEIIKREVDTNRTLYNNLLQRQKEVSVSTALAGSNIHILDRAEPPRSPYKPNKTRNILLSLIFGLFGGICLAFFAEYFDDTIKTGEEIEKRTRLPFLGAIPFKKIEAGQFIRVNAYKNETMKEAFRSISTYIQFSTASKPPKQILFTSPLNGEGKTTSSVNTAMSLTNFLGKGVIVDADLRKPSIHNFFSIDNSSGLSSFLSGNVEFEEMIKKFPYLNLDVIPAGPVPPNPSELLHSERMRELVDALSAIYDFMIVDSPPVLGLSDSPILATFVEGVIVVIKANSTPRDALIQTKKILNGVNAKILGVVLNGISHEPFYYSSIYGSEKHVTKKEDI